MACVNADGTITPTARALLNTLESPLGAEEIAARLNVPLFRVRSSLREMVDAGLVVAQDEKFQATEEGKAKAKAS
jgi:predicted transcriptional regulator